MKRKFPPYSHSDPESTVHLLLSNSYCQFSLLLLEIYIDKYTHPYLLTCVCMLSISLPFYKMTVILCSSLPVIKIFKNYTKHTYSHPPCPHPQTRKVLKGKNENLWTQHPVKIQNMARTLDTLLYPFLSPLLPSPVQSRTHPSSPGAKCLQMDI